MVRLLERRFVVEVLLERAWAHLEKVERWPSWARHIRRIRLRPPGPLTATSQGTIHLTNGIRSTFRMEELNAGANWKWAGKFLWLTVHYDHRFDRLGPRETGIRFVLDGEGVGAASLGRLFAALYARNLDRAIPNLIQELLLARQSVVLRLDPAAMESPDLDVRWEIEKAVREAAPGLPFEDDGYGFARHSDAMLLTYATDDADRLVAALVSVLETHGLAPAAMVAVAEGGQTAEAGEEFAKYRVVYPPGRAGEAVPD